MFKFVVLCAIFAAAAAKPSGLLYSAPITQYSTFVSPATTSISKQESSVIHPSPAFDFAYGNVIAAPSPLVYSSSILPAAPVSPALHLIKKRSAPLLPAATYYTPQFYAQSAPILTTSYSSAAHLIPSAPLISQPLTYTHLIKKRSAPLLNTYIAPAAHAPLTPVSYSAPIAYTSPISYSSPIAYTSPLGYSHVY